MTKEEIIDMVREAGLDWHTGWTLEDDEPNRFVTFSKLIAEKERKEWAREFAGMGEWTAVNMLEERGQE